jgi:hypothetical protein
MLKTFTTACALLAVTSLCQARVDAPYGQVPMAFELNRGQTDAAVNFLSRGQGYALFLTPGEAVLSWRTPAPGQSSVVRMRIAGADLQAHASGVDALPTVSNYFNGGDPAHWHTGIPNYARVRYKGVYPGIDLVYYGNQQQLEYDFVVAPGADPRTIALDFTGVQGVTLNAEGDLVLATADGTLVQHKPIVYQYRDQQHQVIDGHYVIEGSRVHFAVAAYDHSQPLIIDPTLAYSTYLGGKDFDYGDSIAVDANGEAYVTGLVFSARFPGMRGEEFQASGSGDVLVAKLSRNGSQLLYSTYIGGSSQDVAYGIAVDPKGNAYVTGYTRSQDFPITHNTVQPRFVSKTGQNAFVTRLDLSGSLTYSTYLGGTGSDTGRGIAVDSSGDAYVTGYTTSADFPTSEHAFQKVLAGQQNAFVTKLSPNGGRVEYSTFLGGDDYDFGFGIAVNREGNAYVTGTTWGIFNSTFPTTSNAFQTVYAGGGDAFVSKFSTDGSALVYSTLLGGAGNDGGRGIALDTGGNAYVTGFTLSNAFPITTGALQTTLNGTEDAFVTKLSGDGSKLSYSTYLGGSGNDATYGIAVGSNGYAYVTGFTLSPDFPTTAGPIQTANGSWREPFVTALNATGTQLAYSTYLGGTNGDSGYAIAVDSGNNTYVTGYTNSIDFPVTAGAHRTELATGATQDVFIAKISSASPSGN